ncbi:MAG: hypothetical protein S0880_11915, partial [Actinomycetota bacterium]|nr:hypothetical protein [Actinomycetota bacterium]
AAGGAAAAGAATPGPGSPPPVTSPPPGRASTPPPGAPAPAARPSPPMTDPSPGGRAAPPAGPASTPSPGTGAPGGPAYAGAGAAAASAAPRTTGDVGGAPPAGADAAYAANGPSAGAGAPTTPVTEVPLDGDGGGPDRRNLGLILGSVVGVIVLGIIAIVVLGGGGGDGDGEDVAQDTTTTADQQTTTSAAPATSAPVVETTPTTRATTTTVDPYAEAGCDTEKIENGDLYVCATEVSVDATTGSLVVPFESSGFEPEIAAGQLHVHFYLNVPPMSENELNAGSSGPNSGTWVLWDTPLTFANTGDNGRQAYTVEQARAAGATQICTIIAEDTHAVIPNTGNCLDLPPEAL